LFVDRAIHLPPDHAIQRYATRRRRVGSTHAYGGPDDLHGQRWRNTGLIAMGQIGLMKIDTEGGAAGTAGKAGKIGHEYARK
jgi:hypothetical protein